MLARVSATLFQNATRIAKRQVGPIHTTNAEPLQNDEAVRLSEKLQELEAKIDTIIAIKHVQAVEISLLRAANARLKRELAASKDAHAAAPETRRVTFK